MDSEHFISPPELPLYPVHTTFPRLVAAAGSLTMLAACGSLSTGNPAESLRPSQSSTGNCSERPVSIGGRLNAANANDVGSQLQTLLVANSPNVAVTVDDAVHAVAAVANSLIDPAYAKAFTYANQQDAAHRAVAVAQLLKANYPSTIPRCVGDQTSQTVASARDQVHETNLLYGALVKGLAPRAGRQMSASAKFAYEAFKAGYTTFMQKYDQPETP